MEGSHLLASEIVINSNMMTLVMSLESVAIGAEDYMFDD